MKSLLLVALSVVAFACCACFSQAAPDQAKADRAQAVAKHERFVIDQSADGNGAYIHLRDRQTSKSIVVVADRWLPYVAFYDSYKPGDLPQLTISGQGLQLVEPDGKHIRLIELKELAALDNGKPISMRK
jgi:hypothetical protein